MYIQRLKIISKFEFQDDDKLQTEEKLENIIPFRRIVGSSDEKLNIVFGSFSYSHWVIDHMS